MWCPVLPSSALKIDRTTLREPGAPDEGISPGRDGWDGCGRLAGPGLRRLYHPYDGGADVYLASTEERDRLKERHAGWLSGHPNGL
ncbi:DUF3885 domain-containing protein [Streptomyces sp. CB02056]|uniref:DUF3885 domain-containing protein n=2 Tax=Streptomycetaceae TaxID=2062 RepID=UPI000A9A0779